MDFPSTGQIKAAESKIVIYPPGVKEISDKITNDEVVKRLKVSSRPQAFPVSPTRLFIY